MDAPSDLALQSLLLPLTSGTLELPQTGAVFLRAHMGVPMQQLSRERLLCEQSFKPSADQLSAAGFAVSPSLENMRRSLVLLLPPRQRAEARALLARAWDLCEEGGIVLAATPNAMGAKSAESDFRTLFGIDGQLSKHHCRTYWARKQNYRVDTVLLQQWRTLDAPRGILDGHYMSRPGLFSWDRVDVGSQLLAEHLPQDLHGSGADFGAGWGYLAERLLAANPGIAKLDLYEAEARALTLARGNTLRYADKTELEYLWHDVTSGVSNRYDFIVCNPPFHDPDGAVRPVLGQRFIQVAAQALHRRGRLWLVANRQLPYESILDAQFAKWRSVTECDGFKIIEASKGTA